MKRISLLTDKSIDALTVLLALTGQPLQVIIEKALTLYLAVLTGQVAPTVPPHEATPAEGSNVEQS
jgi:hypothetical protein